MAAAATDSLRIVTSEQIDSYHERGYLLIEGAVSSDWLARLRAASDEFVEASRELTASSKQLDIEAGHTPDEPRLRRLINPVDAHPTFTEFAFAGPAADIALDLLGSPARFHHSKLNYKWSGGGEAVEWHQDIQYWPHTDFTPLTIGVYLHDVDETMGPMGIVPGSHRGELFNLYADDDSTWTGSIREQDLPQANVETADYLMGPAGSITVHNCGCVHGSMPNRSDRVRPLLLQTYSAYDSYPLLGIGTNGAAGRHSGSLVGPGAAARTVTVDGRSIRTAPDWSRGGYTTIFAAQHDHK
jgi:ectoine hydroxylase-related dioxygenase (phytanoyl-CoA dioxygenase family)